MEDIIKEAQSVLNNGGNIIKTRDDRELILVDKDGKIQNAAKCGWLPEKMSGDRSVASEFNNGVILHIPN